jgi:hypothetical protein
LASVNIKLIETAKANDLEPFDRLTKVLEKLPHANTLEDYEALPPGVWNVDQLTLKQLIKMIPTG